MSGALDHTAGRASFGNSRALPAPLGPLAVVGLAVALGENRGTVTLLVVLLVVVLAVSALVALSPGVVIDGDRLSVPGREDRRRRPGGSVDLTRLTSAKSVSYRGGLVSGRGLALFRSQLALEDADGGQAMFPAWGWTPKRPLQEALRAAVTTSRARMDPLTYLRLGFRPDQGVRISPLRRLL